VTERARAEAKNRIIHSKATTSFARVQLAELLLTATSMGIKRLPKNQSLDWKTSTFGIFSSRRAAAVLS
jgi:hypothetical protein